MASREKLIEKAQKYLQKAKYKDALKIYEKILQETPRDSRIILRKGEMEEKLGFSDDAIESYRKVAGQYSDEGFYPKAIAIYKKILKINPKDMGIHMKLGMLYKKMNIDTEAKHYYTKVAQHYKSTGLKSEYLEVVKLISEFTGEDTGSKIDLAQEYLEQGDREQAIDQFRAASQRIFESANVRELDLLVEKMDRLGLEDLDTFIIQIKTYMSAKEPKKALRIIQQAYSSHPTNTDVLEMLAFCFKELHQPEKSASVYDELIGLYKKNGEMEKATRSTQSKEALGVAKGNPSASASNTALDDLAGDLDGAELEGEGRTEVFKVEKHSEDNSGSLDDLASFEEVQISEDTQLSREGKRISPKAGKKEASDDAFIQDLNFIKSTEISPDSEEIEFVAPKPQQPKAAQSKKEVKKATLEDVEEFASQPSAEISQEIGMLIDNDNSRIADPYSDDISGLSFESFDEPVAESGVSEEEISGLIDTPSKADKRATPKQDLQPKQDDSIEMDDDGIDLSAIEKEMFQNDDFEAQPFGLKDAHQANVESVENKPDVVEEDVMLTSFDDFHPEKSEASELSVNEEEFVMVQEQLDESSLANLSKEDAAGHWSGNDVDNVDQSPAAETLLSVDMSELDLDDASPDETQFDPINQTQVNQSTHDFGQYGEDLESAPIKKDALELPDLEEDFISGGLEEVSSDIELNDSSFGLDHESSFDVQDDQRIEKNQDEEPLELEDEIGLSQTPVPPSMDLDNIQFETDDSFPEHELSSPSKPLPNNISDDDKSDFFDLADSLKDEIDDLERSFSKPEEELDDEDHHLSPEEVILEFKKGVARTIDKSDSQTYYDLGAAYKEMGLLDEAISAFETAKKNPQYKIDATSLIGICYMAKKDYPQAIETFDQILQSISYQDPKALGIRYELAECYICLGRHLEGYKEFKKIRDVEANFRDVKTRTKELAFNLGIEEKDSKQQAGKIIVNLKERKKNKL